MNLEAFFYIEGNNPATLNMTVIWTTPKLLSRMSCQMIQDDATYKCNWYQYPLFVAGRSTPTGRFYQTHLALSSHEDTAAWIRIHAWVRSVLPRMPRYLFVQIRTGINMCNLKGEHDTADLGGNTNANHTCTTFFPADTILFEANKEYAFMLGNFLLLHKHQLFPYAEHILNQTQ